MKKPAAALSAILSLALVQACSKVDGQSKAAEEVNISEAVHRYQIDHCYSGAAPELWFLGRSDKDPSPEVMNRFKGDRPPVKGRSHMTNEFRDRDTGKKGILILVEEITWVNDSEVEVTGGCIAGPRNGHGSRYHLKRENGSWQVKAVDPTWISRTLFDQPNQLGNKRINKDG